MGFQSYHRDLHVKFGGIRKPRIANAQMLAEVNASGYLLDGEHSHDSLMLGSVSWPIIIPQECARACDWPAIYRLVINDDSDGRWARRCEQPEFLDGGGARVVLEAAGTLSHRWCRVSVLSISSLCSRHRRRSQCARPSTQLWIFCFCLAAVSGGMTKARRNSRPTTLGTSRTSWL